MIAPLAPLRRVSGFPISLRHRHYGYVGTHRDAVHPLHLVGFLDDDERVREAPTTITFRSLIVIVIVIAMRGYEVCFVDLKFLDLIVDVGPPFHDDKTPPRGSCGRELHVTI